MTENQKTFFIKKFSRVCDAYLALFIVIGTIASTYIGITNYKIHEAFFNKPLIACLFLTIATAMLLFLRMERRVNIAILHFSVFFGLFFINAFLEVPFITNLNSVEGAAWRAGIKWDKRNRHEVIEDYRKEGNIAYSHAFFAAFVGEREFFEEKFNFDFKHNLFPLSGIANVKTVLCNESGEWVSYFSDRYGFNNDDNVYENTHNSIILVGDSFTHGFCVKPGDDIAGNLRRRGYRAINLAAGGNGPLIELATLREYGPHLKPKIILWIYFEGNDFVELPLAYSYEPLKRYLNKDYNQNLVKKQDEIDKFWINFFNLAKEDLAHEVSQQVFWNQNQNRKYRKGQINGLIRRIVSLHNIRKRFGLSRNSHIIPEEATSKEREMMFRTVMKAALQEAERLDSKLYFVHLPRFDSLFNEKYRLLPSFQTARKVVSELGIPLIDFYEYLKSTEDPMKYFPLRKNGHYNAEGYNLLADLIEAEVLKHGK